MLTTTKNQVRLSAIVLGIVFASFPVLKSEAQDTTAESFSFDSIIVGNEEGWQFPSENETVSLQDEIKELGDYSVSDADNFRIELIQQNTTLVNQGDRPTYYIENRIAPYYSIETQIYDY